MTKEEMLSELKKLSIIVNEDTINKTINYISCCDLLIVAGTSLTVYPASSFIRFFKGKHLVIINKDITPLDNLADLIINDNLSNVFKKLT